MRCVYHFQILKPIRTWVGFGSGIEARNALVLCREQQAVLASSPGHSQILSCSRGEKSVFLHGCEIKSGSGLGTRLEQFFFSLCKRSGLSNYLLQEKVISTYLCKHWCHSHDKMFPSLLLIISSPLLSCTAVYKLCTKLLWSLKFAIGC